MTARPRERIHQHCFSGRISPRPPSRQQDFSLRAKKLRQGALVLALYRALNAWIDQICGLCKLAVLREKLGGSGKKRRQGHVETLGADADHRRIDFLAEGRGGPSTKLDEPLPHLCTGLPGRDAVTD